MRHEQGTGTRDTDSLWFDCGSQGKEGPGRRLLVDPSTSPSECQRVTKVVAGLPLLYDILGHPQIAGASWLLVLNLRGTLYQDVPCTPS
jgi:hypothetical protein